MLVHLQVRSWSIWSGLQLCMYCLSVYLVTCWCICNCMQRNLLQSSVYLYLLYVLYVSSFNAACLQYMRIHLVCSGGIVVPARLKTVNTMLDGLDQKGRKQSSANKKRKFNQAALGFWCADRRRVASGTCCPRWVASIATEEPLIFLVPEGQSQSREGPSYLHHQHIKDVYGRHPSIRIPDATRSMNAWCIHPNPIELLWFR